jgi:hypothetical protein
LSQDRDQWRALVKIVWDYEIKKKKGEISSLPEHPFSLTELCSKELVMNLYMGKCEFCKVTKQEERERRIVAVNE